MSTTETIGSFRELSSSKFYVMIPMPIPDYQSAMLPLLKLVADGRECKFNDLVETLSEQYKLTEEEKSELLPSGQTFLFGNRIGWARTYLKKACLLDSIKSFPYHLPSLKN